MFALTSWAAQSASYPTSKPQTLFARTTHAPWTVALPPCFWQVDFRRISPTVEFAAGRLGGHACPATTTTTAAAPKTTTTISPPGAPRNAIAPAPTTTMAPAQLVTATTVPPAPPAPIVTTPAKVTG